MAIKLEVKPYCADCCDFEADVVKPERKEELVLDPGRREWYVNTLRTDTLVRCKYARRCEAMMRYLNQSKAEENYEQLEIGDIQ